MSDLILSAIFGVIFMIVLPPLALWLNGGKSHSGLPLWRQYIKDIYNI